MTNAVRCVPPQNKVTGDEQKNCRPFLIEEIKSMPNLKIILSLGAVSHGAVLSALSCKKSDFKFKHGAVYYLRAQNLILVDSYHTSRYNINTGVLTNLMFEDVIKTIKDLL